MLSSQRYNTRDEYLGRQLYQGRQKQGRSARGGGSEGVFRGIRAAFLTGGRDEEDLIDMFREHGGRVLDLQKCNYNFLSNLCLNSE